MVGLKLQVSLIVAVMCNFFAFGDAKNLTTNDIDEVFLGMDSFPRPFFRGRCRDCGLRDVSIPQPEIRYYALDKLLALTVSTNSPRFWGVIKENSELIESSESLFGMKLREQELQKILSNIQRYQLISTNSLEKLGDQAVAQYKQKYGNNRHYFNGMRREFIDEWMWHRDRVLNWNKEITEYRRKLIAFVCRKYHEIHADVPEKERTEALVRLLSEYGFSLPKGNEPSNP